MYRLLSKIYKEIRPWIIASCTFLFWCVPVLSVRFSSEILGGAFLCIAICRILDTDKKKIWNHLIIGSLMGLSFITRFQMGLCILGIFIWALTMNRYSFKICSVWIIGIFFSLIILLLCDFHVYDEWVFTPWSYFKSNLIEGVSSDFGVKPFYHYFHQLVLKLSPPIGLALILCLFISLFKRKFHLFNVVIWSLLVTHMVIPHKELRFIYPLIFLSPWLILEAYIFIRKWKYARLILIPIAVVNLFIIIPALAAPAGEGQIRMIRLLEEKNENKNKPLILNFTPKNNPLDPLGGLYANFYIESPVEYKEVDLLNDMGYKDKIFPGEFFVLSEKDFERLNAENWNVIDYNLQPWLHPFYRIYRGRKFRLLLLISPK